MIETQFGPAEILSPGKCADGSPGWYVIIRRKDAAVWPFKGAFIFRVVPQ